MPVWEEIQKRLAGVTDQGERNRILAQAQQGPELTDVEVAQKWEPVEPELTAEEAERRLTPIQTTPEEEAHGQFVGMVQQMAQNYQTDPQYRAMLDQEIAQINEQIAQLVQRRNMIALATQTQELQERVG